MKKNNLESTPRVDWSENQTKKPKEIYIDPNHLPLIGEHSLLIQNMKP